MQNEKMQSQIAVKGPRSWKIHPFSLPVSSWAQGLEVLLEPPPAIAGWGQGDTLEKSAVPRRLRNINCKLKQSVCSTQTGRTLWKMSVQLLPTGRSGVCSCCWGQGKFRIFLSEGQHSERRLERSHLFTTEIRRTHQTGVFQSGGSCQQRCSRWCCEVRRGNAGETPVRVTFVKRLRGGCAWKYNEQWDLFSLQSICQDQHFLCLYPKKKQKTDPVIVELFCDREEAELVPS